MNQRINLSEQIVIKFKGPNFPPCQRTEEADVKSNPKNSEDDWEAKRKTL